MALVNNASGVYTTLGYNFSDPNGAVQNFSANTQSVMNQLPPIIQAWQAQDIANNTVGGYFQNPVATSVNNIITISNQIYILANSISGNANTTYAGTANLIEINAIGIGHDVSSYYSKALKIGDVQELGDALIDQLADLFIENPKRKKTIN